MKLSLILDWNIIFSYFYDMKFFLALRLPSTWRIRYKVFNDVKLESYIYWQGRTESKHLWTCCKLIFHFWDWRSPIKLIGIFPFSSTCWSGFGWAHCSAVSIQLSGMFLLYASRSTKELENKNLRKHQVTCCSGITLHLRRAYLPLWQNICFHS